MDEAGRSLLEEDLRSPCTEEIAVCCAFAREVGQGTNRFAGRPSPGTDRAVCMGHQLLQRRKKAKLRYLREVLDKHARRTAWLPWQPEAPTGLDALARLAASSLHSVYV